MHGYNHEVLQMFIVVLLLNALHKSNISRLRQHRLPLSKTKRSDINFVYRMERRQLHSANSAALQVT